MANDCSTDNTQAIIDAYAARDNRIKSWINEKNLRLFGNYNRCIERATGKYIKLFAHDDIFQPTLIERMVKVLDDNAQI
ncbi:glycosyltransferase, partial [Acinetobacter baumannii]